MTATSTVASLSYKDFASIRAQTDPSISGLHEYLKRQGRKPSRIVQIDYHTGTWLPVNPDPVSVPERNVGDAIRDIPSTVMRLLLVEDISPYVMTVVGQGLDIDLSFFAEYVNTGFEEIEKTPPPPALASLPSSIVRRGHLHLHHQQVADLGPAAAFADAAYALKTDSNVPRNVRRLAPLSGKQLALCRTCCSVSVRETENQSICLILIDRPISSVVEAMGTQKQQIYPAKRLHGGFERLSPPQSFSSFLRDGGGYGHVADTSSMLSSLVQYYQSKAPLMPRNQPPTAVGVGYGPICIVLAEWHLYTLLTSRYSKYYEYSLRDVATRLHDDDLIELQRWRRRVKQSRNKLTVLAELVDHWRSQDDKEACGQMVQDISFLQRELENYNQLLDHMVSMATSMLQLIDSRRSIIEAVSVRRLTVIALVFVPLSWVASLFSMSDAYSPGHKRFWVYFATAVPLVCLVLLLSVLPYERAKAALKHIWHHRGARHRFQV